MPRGTPSQLPVTRWAGGDVANAVLRIVAIVAAAAAVVAVAYAAGVRKHSSGSSAVPLAQIYAEEVGAALCPAGSCLVSDLTNIAPNLWLVKTIGSKPSCAILDARNFGVTGNSFRGFVRVSCSPRSLVTPGRLTVAISGLETSFWSPPADQPRGFDVDLMTALAEQIGVRTVTWVRPDESGNLLPHDLLIGADATVGAGRKPPNAVGPFMEATESVLVRRGSRAEGVRTKSDLGHLRLGVYASPPLRLPQRPQRFKVAGDAIAALLAGKIDAVVTGTPDALEFIRLNPGKLEIPLAFRVGEYVIMLPSGSSLRPIMARALMDLERRGTVRTLETKWFPGLAKLRVVEPFS